MTHTIPPTKWTRDPEEKARIALTAFWLGLGTGAFMAGLLVFMCSLAKMCGGS